MSNRIKNNLKNLVGQTLNQYYSKVKPTISDLRYKQEYQNRIIECMVGEVDDNYITTPETDNPIVKLEHSKEGLVKVPSIKGKTILVDADGNETDISGEGCRLVSVGEEEDNKLIILSNNSNLVRSEYIKDMCATTKIKVEPNTTYYVYTENRMSNNAFCWLHEYDKDGVKITNGINLWSNNFTTKHNTCEIHLNSAVSFTDTLVLSKSPINGYIPNKHHKTEILLDEPLRSLPNGVCDEIVGNQLIRRVGSTIINGQGNFSVQSLNSNNKVLCDYSVTPNSKLYGNQNCVPKYPFGIGNMSTRVLKLTMDITEDYAPTTHTQAREIFKKHYTENPMEVLYELEEPIIEELPNSITLQGFDDTTMYIENSITPTVQYGYNALIPYKEELRTQKEEVETNTLDIENNIIPYLMDMEFNLMLMEDNE